MASWNIYDHFRLNPFSGTSTNLGSGGNGVKVALITSAVAPNQASDTTFSGASYTEVSGTNYTAGGLAIDPGQSIALATGTVTYKSSTTITWTQSGTGFSNARYAVIYDTVSGLLICYGDFGSNIGNVIADLTITGPSTAIWTSP